MLERLIVLVEEYSMEVTLEHLLRVDCANSSWLVESRETWIQQGIRLGVSNHLETR